MSEELMITKEDLVNWLNRPPNNDDLDLIGFITTRLENFYKLEQENKQLKNILTELEEHCEVMLRIFEKMSEEQRQEQLDKYIIYDKFLGKIQELKEEYK